MTNETFRKICPERFEKESCNIDKKIIDSRSIKGENRLSEILQIDQRFGIKRVILENCFHKYLRIPRQMVSMESSVIVKVRKSDVTRSVKQSERSLQNPRTFDTVPLYELEKATEIKLPLENNYFVRRDSV